MVGVESVITGAISALIFSTIAFRWGSRLRVRGSAEGESAVGLRVHSGAPKANHGRPGRVPGRGGRVPGSDGVVSSGHMIANFCCNSMSILPPAERGTVHLPDADHVSEFIAWVITDEDGNAQTVRFRHKQLLANYRTWAHRSSVQPLPELRLLALLGRNPAIKRTRERVKEKATGRVVRLPSGTPVRESYYTLAPSRHASRLPGKAPVASIVPVAQALPSPAAPYVPSERVAA